MEQPQQQAAPQRVSPLALPDAYRLPPRPDAAADAASADAHRQTGFLLGKDLHLFERGMNLQLAILRDSYAVRYRTHRFAAVTMLWSRAYACARDAVALSTQGAYASVLPLLEATADEIAGQVTFPDQDEERFERRLSQVGRPDEQHRATIVPVEADQRRQIVAEDDELGPIQRATAFLASADFGASLIQVAPESNVQKLAVAFAERAFHLGWAELTLGWALALCARQLALATRAGDILNITDERRQECSVFANEARALLGRPDRCAFEERATDGQPAFVIVNFRRAPAGAPRRILFKSL